MQRGRRRIRRLDQRLDFRRAEMIMGVAEMALGIDALLFLKDIAQFLLSEIMKRLGDTRSRTGTAETQRLGFEDPHGFFVIQPVEQITLPKRQQLIVAQGAGQVNDAPPGIRVLIDTFR